jgi:hypothetical protein
MDVWEGKDDEFVEESERRYLYWCVMWRYVVLCGVMLYYVVLCGVMWCYVVLCGVISKIRNHDEYEDKTLPTYLP